MKKVCRMLVRWLQVKQNKMRMEWYKWEEKQRLLSKCRKARTPTSWSKVRASIQEMNKNKLKNIEKTMRNIKIQLENINKVITLLWGNPKIKNIWLSDSSNSSLKSSRTDQLKGSSSFHNLKFNQNLQSIKKFNKLKKRQ